LSSRPIPDIGADAFEAGFGEPLSRTLDLDTWSSGEELSEIYERVAAEVEFAVSQESRVRALIRQEVFPYLSSYPGAPKGAGVYEARLADLERVHRGLLFNGGVEACDGTQRERDTIPLTILHVGISLVSYQGDQGTWAQRLFRRDLRATSDDPIEEMLELLDRRVQRSGLHHPSRRDALTTLARRGIMAYGERAVLLRRSEAPWRMGHGSPAPVELISGSGSVDLMIQGTKLIRELVEQHQQFVFVASEPSDRMLLTIGQALRPLEYAIVGTLDDRIRRTIDQGHYHGRRVSVDRCWDGQELSPEAWIARFRDDVASQVVVGVYRATHHAPAQMFYAHRDHADIAAHIVIGDSMLQAHRGFPMLIDLADSVCRSVFGSDTIEGPVSAAYAGVNAPWRYLGERATRPA
jgi:hypothetical protein